jgi:predicted nuclease with TOPRIM domain
MSNLQEVFSRIRETRKEQKKLKDAYRDALSNSTEYRQVSDDLKDLKNKKKQIEADTKAQFSSEFTRLDDLKIDLESDAEMLSDIALTQLMKGETVKVKDEYEAEYEPVFSVKFKKAT